MPGKRKATGRPRKPKAKPAARASSLLARSARSGPSRRRNVLSSTPNTRIKGHTLGAQRRSQAKRDARQRRK